jgi:hypothetical protein
MKQPLANDKVQELNQGALYLPSDLKSLRNARLAEDMESVRGIVK